MPFTDEQLNDIYDRTAGRCHICWKRLAFSNYAEYGQRAAWEVDHSRPRARGGTDHLNNLYPACISCNRSKGHRSTRTMRARHGQTRAPRSRDAQDRVQAENAFAGAVLGWFIGGGVGALIGAMFGSSIDAQ